VEGKLDLARIHKKIAEAHFFLCKMIEQEPRLIGDKEPFDHYLSAFLSAAISVCDGFHYRQNRARNYAIKAWREQWENNLVQEERHLYDFMRADRVAEIHRAGSRRDVGHEIVKFPIGTHRVGGSEHYVAGPPDMEPVAVDRPTFTFTIAGIERKVTEASAAYLALLQRMAAQFEVDRPYEPSETMEGDPGASSGSSGPHGPCT
jgi:hypothetical protein